LDILVVEAVVQVPLDSLVALLRTVVVLELNQLVLAILE
jgi:hypothetical protein